MVQAFYLESIINNNIVGLQAEITKRFQMFAVCLCLFKGKWLVWLFEIQPIYVCFWFVVVISS